LNFIVIMNNGKLPSIKYLQLQPVLMGARGFDLPCRHGRTTPLPGDV
jgi:hypothetical protein